MTLFQGGIIQVKGTFPKYDSGKIEHQIESDIKNTFNSCMKKIRPVRINFKKLFMAVSLNFITSST